MDPEERLEEEEEAMELVNGNYTTSEYAGANAGGAEEFYEEEEEEQAEAQEGTVPYKQGAPSSSSTLAFPIARVRKLIKSENNDIQMIGIEAIVAITKATELFLEKFVEKSFDHMCKDNRSTLTYKDVSSTVEDTNSLDFLKDFVPHKKLAFDALKAQAQNS